MTLGGKVLNPPPPSIFFLIQEVLKAYTPVRGNMNSKLFLQCKYYLILDSRLCVLSLYVIINLAQL